MATVRLERERVASGALPEVCVKTGEPADAVVPATFEDLPAWTYLLLLAGVLPFLIALVFAREQVHARLPVRRRVVERYRRRTRWLWLWLGLTLATVTLAVAVGEPWLLAGLIVTVLGALAVSIDRAQGWVHARPVRGTSLVELRRVSPTLVTAIRPEASTGRGR